MPSEIERLRSTLNVLAYEHSAVTSELERLNELATKAQKLDGALNIVRALLTEAEKEKPAEPAEKKKA